MSARWRSKLGRRITVRTSARPDEVRALVATLPEALPPMLPLLPAPPTDVGFEDDAPKARTPWRLAHRDATRFRVSYAAQPLLAVRGRVAPAACGASLEIQLGLDGAVVWPFVLAGLFAVTALSIVTGRALLVLAWCGGAALCSWGSARYLARRLDAVEAAVVAHFPPAEVEPAGPFR